MIKTRKSRKMTQAEVAKLLGKPQSYVAKYELGERRLDVVEMIEISKAIGIDSKKLFLSLLESLK